MSSKVFLTLLLDSPMQSWGHTSRFDRRTTALHPTRSGVLGIIAAAMGVDKYSSDEIAQIQRLEPLRITTVALGRRDQQGQKLPMRRLEDYHTVTGIRRASGKVARDSTVQTYRHYLLDACFGVLLEGPDVLLEEIAKALKDPKWGVWFGRKSCLPASPVLAAGPGPLKEVWGKLLKCADLPASLAKEKFVQVIETTAIDPDGDMLEDTPVGFSRSIGERHAPRWIKHILKSVID
jgi:CRISPR system Cascade subunit CasD